MRHLPVSDTGRIARPTRLLGSLVIAFAVAGCSHFDWIVSVYNDTSVDVIVRVEYAGGSRDVLLSANGFEPVLWLPDPRTPATISLLDPTSCEVRASGNLPAEPAWVGIADGPTPGTFALSIQPHNEATLRQAPADARCSGH